MIDDQEHDISLGVIIEGNILLQTWSNKITEHFFLDFSMEDKKPELSFVSIGLQGFLIPWRKLLVKP